MPRRLAASLLVLFIAACGSKVTYNGEPGIDDDGPSVGQPTPATPTSACNETPVLGCANPGETCNCSGFECEAFAVSHDTSCTITCGEDFAWSPVCIASGDGGGYGEGGYSGSWGGNTNEGGFQGEGGVSGEGGFEGEGGFVGQGGGG